MVIAELNQPCSIKYEFKVKDCEIGIRLDKYIASQLKECGRIQVQRLITGSKVFVNSKIENRCNKRIRAQDFITMIVMKKEKGLKPYKLWLNIVFEDDYIILVNKPPNLTVHPSNEKDTMTLVNALIHYSKNLSSLSGNNMPGIVHRLDKGTSGLIIIAKNNAVHLHLRNQMVHRKIKRRYMALTYNTPNPVMGNIRTYLVKCKKQYNKMQVTDDSKMGKNAITNYRVVSTYLNGMFSLVKCDLETGRTHQIRVHMQYKNSPIIGDQKYSAYYNFSRNHISKDLAKSIDNLSRQALHAYKISFLHPVSCKMLHFEIPLSQEMKNIISLLETS